MGHDGTPKREATGCNGRWFVDFACSERHQVLGNFQVPGLRSFWLRVADKNPQNGCTMKTATNKNTVHEKQQLFLAT